MHCFLMILTMLKSSVPTACMVLTRDPSKQMRKKSQLKKHMETCFTYGGVKVEMPKEDDKTLKFTQVSKQLKHSHCGFADFESTVRKVDDTKSVHEISGYNLKITSPYFPTRIYKHTGADAGAKFVKKVEELSEELHEEIQNANAPMIFTERDAQNFHLEQICHICEKQLPDKSTHEDHLKKTEPFLSALGLNLNQIPTSKEVDNMKYEGDEASPDYITWAKGKENLKTYLAENNQIVVRDHDHFNGNIYYKSYNILNFFVGKYRGAAHQLCNLNYKKSTKIPIFFHNLTG